MELYDLTLYTSFLFRCVLSLRVICSEVFDPPISFTPFTAPPISHFFFCSYIAIVLFFVEDDNITSDDSSYAGNAHH